MRGCCSEEAYTTGGRRCLPAEGSSVPVLEPNAEGAATCFLKLHVLVLLDSLSDAWSCSEIGYMAVLSLQWWCTSGSSLERNSPSRKGVVAGGPETAT